MESIGWLFMLFAAGTLIGIVVFIFGLRRKSKLTKTGGAMSFIVCAGALVFLITEYGTQPVKKILSPIDVSYNVASWKHIPFSGNRKDVLQKWKQPVTIDIGGGKLYLNDKGGTAVERSFSDRDTVWVLGSATGSSKLLNGNYFVTPSGKGDLMLTKIEGSLKELIWLVPEEE